MMSTTQTLGNDLARLSHRVSTFVELTKPRLVAMILITTLGRLLSRVFGFAQLGPTSRDVYRYGLVRGGGIGAEPVH